MTHDHEMRRLILHAADLLDACDPMASANIVEDITSTRAKALEARDHATQEAVAIATAITVLRWVAACMAVRDDERERKTAPFVQDRDLVSIVLALVDSEDGEPAVEGSATYRAREAFGLYGETGRRRGPTPTTTTSARELTT